MVYQNIETLIGEDYGMSIKIYTVYFEGKYTPDYVGKLYDSLKRNTSLPFEFICYSDNPNVKADKVIPLPREHSTPIRKHWHKIAFFCPLFGYQKPGDEIIVMDIDQVIVGNMDDIIGYKVKDNQLVSYRKWWGAKDGQMLNGGFYKFKSGHLQKIWDKFIRSPEDWQLLWFKKGIVHYKWFGEQNFVQHMCKKFGFDITLMPGEWIGKMTIDPQQNLKNNIDYCKKYDKDYMVLDRPNPSLKVIHFANPHTDIHNSEYEWIKDYWK